MYINLSELQKYLASGKAFARSIVYGLPYLPNGNEKGEENVGNPKSKPE